METLVPSASPTFAAIMVRCEEHGGPWAVTGGLVAALGGSKTLKISHFSKVRRGDALMAPKRRNALRMWRTPRSVDPDVACTRSRQMNPRESSSRAPPVQGGACIEVGDPWS